MTNRGYTVLSIAALAVIAVGTYVHASTLPPVRVLLEQCLHVAMPEVSAQAAYVYDLKTGAELFAKNGEVQLPLASLTKLATAVVAASALPADTRITISQKALAPEGDSGFFAGEVWQAQDLLDFTLITSSNDGARALALAAAEGSLESFVQQMNALARTIGTGQMFFVNETGLDVSSSTAGAYGSARDVAHLLSYAYTHSADALSGSAQSASVFTSLSGTAHEATHTTSVAGSVPGELIVKTGFTDLAGGNLAVLAEVVPGRPVAVVVLGATRETREKDVAVLMDAARAEVKRATLCAKM